MHTQSKNNQHRNSLWNQMAGTKPSILMAALVLLLGAGVATAGEGWDFTVDAAAYAENTYVGSDEYYATPFPAIRAAHRAGNTTWFVSLPLEGVGVSHRNPKSGLTSSLAMNFGGFRSPEEYSVIGFPVKHSDRVRTLLAGSPEVSTPVVLEAKVEYPLPFGLLGVALGYHPTSTKSGQAGIADQVRHGFLLSMQYTTFVPVTRRIAVGSVLGFEVMDGSYAEAWFSVSQETEQLAGFDAEAGTHDAQATLFASFQVAMNVNLSLFYRNTLLLGDAADCPFTLDQRQQSFLLRTSYSF